MTTMIITQTSATGHPYAPHPSSATLLIEQRYETIRNAAAELQQVAGVIKARQSPLPDHYTPSSSNTNNTSNTNINNDSTTTSTSTSDNSNISSTPTMSSQQQQQHQSLLFNASNDTGASFALPVSPKLILAHIQTLATNLDSFAKAGIVVESVADSLWTIISHVVNVASISIRHSSSVSSSANNVNNSSASAASSSLPSTATTEIADEEGARMASYIAQKNSSSSKNTTAKNSSPPQQQIQLISERSQRAARQAFIAQAALITACVALWDTLAKRFTSKLFHSPLEQGKLGVVQWCEQLTNGFVAMTTSSSVSSSSSPGSSSSAKEANNLSTSSSESSMNQNSNNTSLPSFFSSLQNFFNVMASSSSSSTSNTTAANIDPKEFAVIFVDSVIALWSLLETCCYCLERALFRSTQSVSNKSTLRVGEVSDFYTSATSYFLGSGARTFAKESNNSAALRWCSIAVMTFLPVVDEYFNNGHQVQNQFFLEHLPDVLMRRYSTEQISVVCAYLFAKTTNTIAANQGQQQQQQQQHQQNTSKIAQVNLFNMQKLTQSLKKNLALIDAATSALHRANSNDASPSHNTTTATTTTTSTSYHPEGASTSPITFYNHPVKAFVCCLLAVLTLPSHDELKSPDFVKDFDSATPLLSQAFRRCIVDGACCETPTNHNSNNNPGMKQRQQQHDEIYDASAAMAQLIFVCMVQKVDNLRRVSAVKNGFAPWDNRFQLFSSNSRFHNEFLIEHMKRSVPVASSQEHQKNHNDAEAGKEEEEKEEEKVSFTLLLSKIVMEWCSRTILEYPAPSYYQSPLYETASSSSTTTASSSLLTTVASASPFVLFLRGELLRCVTFPFVDFIDVVAAQNPDCAHVVSLTLLKSLMKSASVVAAAAAAEEEKNTSSLSVPSLDKKLVIDAASRKLEQQQQHQQQRGSRFYVIPASTVNTTMQISSTTASTTTTSTSSPRESSSSNSITTLSAMSTLLSRKATELLSPSVSYSLRRSRLRSLLYYQDFQQFITVRVNQSIAVIERIRRSAFTAIDAAEPWGQLIPRRLYAETSLTFYDVIALCFSALAGDALSIRSSGGFIQAMLKITRKLIPLAQPFCRAALESPATVNALIDRFEKSMADVESSTTSKKSSGQAVVNDNGGTNKQLMFRYLVASFTLSGMTDQQGMRVMPNQVFASRWVPLLSRACHAIEGNEVTRSVLEVHCRNCCSALLRSRRTVCPQKGEDAHTLLYADPITTDGFLRHVTSFLTWVARPAVSPFRSNVSRRISAASFASHLAPCIFSVERLMNEQGRHAGRELCCKILSQVGQALVTQVRQLTPQILDHYQREIYMDGSTKFVEGLASCLACLDESVCDVVKYYLNVILSSLLVVFSMEAKKKVRDTMVQAVGMARHLRGQAHLQRAMWIAEREPLWLREDGSVALMMRAAANNNNSGSIPTAARFVQAKL